MEILSLSEAYGALKFGDFTLKSGRKSPYFFNAGEFNDARSFQAIGRGYAFALHDIYGDILPCDVLFGPAYKGIPLAMATSMGFYECYGINVPFAFNRKEVKDHGEGGRVIGASLKGKRVYSADDVISSGTTVQEIANTIQKEEGIYAGVLLILNRGERGQGNLSAVQEVEERYKIPVIPILTFEDILNFAKNNHPLMVEPMEAYWEQYGAK